MLGAVTMKPVPGPPGKGRGPRRSPDPEERQRDAGNSRRLLLDAALEEFAAKGFAGARVQDIAARAGLNKQLISYYFEGKAGLYRGLQDLWSEREAGFASPDLPLPVQAARYLHDALSEPRMTRLLLWRGLSPDPEGEAEAPAIGGKQQRDLERMRARKNDGELAPDLDPGAILVALMGIVSAPVAFSRQVQVITGMDPATPEFEEFFAEQLQHIVRLLAGCRHHEADTEGERE